MQQTSLSNPSSTFDATVFRRAATFRGADADQLDSIEAREIGFDFARRGMPLPEDTGVAFREGWLEGRARFGQRTCGGTPWDRKLLRLRLSAWRRNRVVDKAVSAAYLEHISVSLCPITREVLTTGTHGLSDATVDRVFNGGAYAVGNLAVMSQRANLAKANRTVEEIIAIARGLGAGERHEGLDGLEWARLASLCAQALPRELGSHYWPLLVWPPNGLMVSNLLGMIMMTTSLVALKFFRPAVAAEARDRCGTKAARKAFDDYIATLRARTAALSKRNASLACVFHPLEDAWCSELVWQRFMKWMRVTTPGCIAAIGLVLHRASARTSRPITDEQFSGWAIESRGYLTQRRDEPWAAGDWPEWRAAA